MTFTTLSKTPWMALAALLTGVAFLAAGAAGQGFAGGLDYERAHCEPIRVPMCQKMLYNETVMPNLMGNTNQDDVNRDIRLYSPLFRLKCSPDIHFFICAMFTPVCTIIPKALPPCRELCLSAKAGCEGMLQKFDYDWPPQFDCDKFPLTADRDKGVLCVGPNQAAFSEHDLKDYHDTTAAPGRPNEYHLMGDFVCPKDFQVGYNRRPYFGLVGCPSKS